jgi:hypothetical protein
VRACLTAKIVRAEIVHIDASLIRADVATSRRYRRPNPPDDEDAGRRSHKIGKYKKVSTTGPDATMATNGRKRRLEPSFKQHTAVDDVSGGLLDVTITTGEVNEGHVRDAG